MSSGPKHEHDADHAHHHGDGHDHHDHGERGHHHGHDHHGHHAHGLGASFSNLKVALFLNLGFSLVELAGGLWTGSVAVLSDAVHDFGDSLALASAWGMEYAASRKAGGRFSYGHRRMSLLSALLTSAFLLVASAFVLSKAIPRLWSPVTPHLPGMLGLAALGMAVNGYAAWRLTKGKTMNERVVSWHMIEDVFGWVTVFIGTLVMMIADVPIIDPILSIGFTLFIFYGVARSLRETLNLFLQASPAGIDIGALRKEITCLKGVIGTHDAHLWSLDGESHVLTVHVVVKTDTTLRDMEAIKSGIRALASKRGKIHLTVEIETEAEICPVKNCVSDGAV